MAPGTTTTPARASRRVRGQVRASLRASTLDGTAHAAMVGLGETYFAALALALGARTTVVGLVATLPILAGALFQLASPAAARRTGAKPWVVGSAALQAALLLLLAGGLAAGAVGVGTLLGLACAYWVCALGLNPAWNAWMGRMIPSAVRSRYFARRNVPIQAAVFGGAFLGGVLIDGASAQWDAPIVGFAVAVALAAGCRAGSVYWLTRQHDPGGGAPEPPLLPWRTVLRGARDGPAGRLVLLLVALHAAVHLSAAYFTPYMLDHLALSYLQYTTLNCVVVLARVVSSRYWGEIAHRHGNRRALQVSATLLVPLSGLWVLSDSFLYLVLLQLFAGFAWAGFEIALVLNFFDCTDARDRAQVLSLYNVTQGVGIVLASLAGGWLLRIVGPETFGYETLFLLSSAARALAVMALARGVGRRRASEYSFREVFTRVVTLRPGQGAAVRPVILPPAQRDGSTQ